MRNRFWKIILLMGMVIVMPANVIAESEVGQEGAKILQMTSDELEGLSLDEGRKWMMDEHTRTSFVKMAERGAVLNVTSLNVDDLKKLGSLLRKDIDGLIKGCTMEGEAHEQLHAFLMGYIPAVEKLSETGAADAAAIVRRYLKNYNVYFE